MSLFRCFNTVYHLGNAELTPELHIDLINFSFNNRHNIFKNARIQNPSSGYSIYDFAPPFLQCLKELVWHHLHPHLLCIFMYLFSF